ESAIEKFLAEACGNGEREIGKQFHGGLRQDPFSDGLKRAPRFDRDAPYAPQVQPLESRNRRRASDRRNKNPGPIMNRQSQLGSAESVRPCAPCHNRDGNPLKGDRRGVKDEALHRADLRQRQQFLHARSPAPRHYQAEHQEDHPNVPGHPRMRTLSASVAQVTKVPELTQFPIAPACHRPLKVAINPVEINTNIRWQFESRLSYTPYNSRSSIDPGLERDNGHN